MTIRHIEQADARVLDVCPVGIDKNLTSDSAVDRASE